MSRGPPMAKPKPARESAFGGDEDIPFIPVSVVNQIYEKGAAGILPTSYQLSSEERQIEDLQEELAQVRAAGQALATDGTLTVQGFQLSPTGLIAPETITSDAWVDVGRLLAKLEGSLQWLIGDWIVFGESIRWGDIPALAQELGFAVQTLYDYASVCRKVQFSTRIENLSFAHHRLVMSMTPDFQTYALKFAAHNKYSVAEFRKWIKADMPEEGLPESTANPPQPTTALPAERQYNVAQMTDSVYSVAQKDLMQIPEREVRSALDAIRLIQRKNADIEAKLEDALSKRLKGGR